MKQPSLLSHLRDIIILPFVVTVVVPWWILVGDCTAGVWEVVSKIAGALLFLPGAGLLFYTIFLFKTKGRGTLAPWSPTQTLIVIGPYRYCRNPMITGVFFMLLGEGAYFCSLNIFIWAGSFFLINTLYFIFKEEPDMYKRFGENYSRYKANVPRWLPRIKPYQPD